MPWPFKISVLSPYNITVAILGLHSLIHWAACVSIISDKVYDLSIETTLLTVFGTILGFVISFRTSSAFERYNEGKKLLSSIAYSSRIFARIVWFHTPSAESSGVNGLEEKHNAISLIQKFSVAIKQHLREPPRKQDKVVEQLISYQDRSTGERKHADKSGEPTAGSTTPSIGDAVIAFELPKSQGANDLHDEEKPVDRGSQGQMSGLRDGSGVPRLSVPLEITFHLISISTLGLYFPLYIFPAFPAMEIAAVHHYPGNFPCRNNILGLLSAGEEIENPFGEAQQLDDDRNDLDMKTFCDDLKGELDLFLNGQIPAPDPEEWKVPIDGISQRLKDKEQEHSNS
ncbi:bestrophin protein [Rhizoctonia solani]|uniref:Bestrophin protein n=1 Tax=Rhizoctonia solani TaxID=456999 RepID=A0A8H8T1B3_9AGAM|nr:bestrophin protein [Rhizoctonia solani]QRW26276.1 bestrophin protein [Rhizoctonia solani]